MRSANKTTGPESRAASPGPPGPPSQDAPPCSPPESALAPPSDSHCQPQAPPCLFLPSLPAQLFTPARHLPEPARAQTGPANVAQPLALAVAARANPGLQLIPRPEDCQALWERYDMLGHIRDHSARVADFAYALSLRARELGLAADPDAVLAAGLLHDLGKTYTIHHGGNHAQLGASWVMRETGNAPVARGVLFHVHWPWDEAALFAALDREGKGDADLFLVMAIIYADKRTKHDAYVSLEERFEDLVARYAVNDFIKGRIGLSHEQGKRVEAALSRRLGVNLNECIADSGRLVQRT